MLDGAGRMSDVLCLGRSRRSERHNFRVTERAGPMTYDQWKDPTEDTSAQERLDAEYEAEMLFEYAAEMDGWEPDDEPLLNPNQARR